MNFKRLEDESNIEFLLRLVGYKLDDKVSDLDWQDIVDVCELNVHRDVLRKAMQPSEFGAYAIYKYMLENSVENEMFEKLEKKIKESKIEVQKMRDLRASENEKLRNQSRKESILEEVRYYIQDLNPIEPPIFNDLQYGKTKMIAGVADEHFGKELRIKGLMGEDINVYNEDVYYERMWNYLKELILIIEEENISKVYFFALSDSIEGILRMSGLQHIKYGIVESTIKYAKFMITWLNELSKYVEIDYYACLGNHNEIRPLNSKSGDFAKENTQYVVDEMLKLGLSNNDRVVINDTSGLQYVDVDGYKVLATHGQDEKNLVNSVKDYKEIYNVDIDLMISGHLHNSKQETASMRSKCIQFPSIVGIDEYSMKLKRTANAEGKVVLIKGNRFSNIDIKL